MEIGYLTLDVFTDEAFGGNPLGVVPDARGLSTEQMQSITREFGYSESTFVLPPADPAHDAEVRIFTPAREIPFAGHPNVGTACALARLGSVHGKPVGEQLLFEERAGLVAVKLLCSGDRVDGSEFTAPQELSLGETLAAEVVAECVGLDPDDMVTARHLPTWSSVGLPFFIAEVRDREALAKAAPKADVFAKHLPIAGSDDIHLYCRCPAEDVFDVRTRMFAPLQGIKEDPATGSANAALTGLLASLEADGTHRFVIAQGVEMGRPSRLDTTAVKAGGAVTEIRVGGHCVTMMRGTLHI